MNSFEKHSTNAVQIHVFNFLCFADFWNDRAPSLNRLTTSEHGQDSCTGLQIKAGHIKNLLLHYFSREKGQILKLR